MTIEPFHENSCLGKLIEANVYKQRKKSQAIRVEADKETSTLPGFKLTPCSESYIRASPIFKQLHLDQKTFFCEELIL